MWGSLGKVAAAAKQAAATVVAEAQATAAELREIHQDEWARKRAQGEGREHGPEAQLAVPASYAAGPCADGPAHALGDSYQLGLAAAHPAAALPQPWEPQPPLANDGTFGTKPATAAGATTWAPPPSPPMLALPTVAPPAQPLQPLPFAPALPAGPASRPLRPWPAPQPLRPGPPPQLQPSGTPPPQPAAAGTAPASDVSSRLASLKAKLQADKARPVANRMVSTAGSSLAGMPRPLRTSRRSLTDVAVPAAALPAPAPPAAAAPAPFVPGASATASLGQEQEASLAYEQQQLSPWLQQQCRREEASPESPLFQAYQPAHADHQPEHQHPSWLPKAVLLQPAPYEEQQPPPPWQQQQRERTQTPIPSEPPALSPLPATAALSASSTPQSGTSLAQEQPLAPQAAADSAAAAAAAAKEAAAREEAASVAAVAAAAWQEDAAAAAQLAKRQRAHEWAAAEAAQQLAEAAVELEGERQVVTSLKKQLHEERQQHVAASGSLEAAQRQAEELSAVCAAEKATLQELAEKLAEARLAEAQLQDERQQHERTQQHLLQLQELQHDSADRSDRLNAAMAELQQQLAVEQQRAADQEQHEHEALAARDAFWQQQLAELQAALQVALAEKQQQAADQEQHEHEALAARDAFWQQQLAELQAALQVALAEKKQLATAAEQWQRDSAQASAAASVGAARLEAEVQEAQTAAEPSAAAQGGNVGEVAAQLEASWRECSRLQQEVERLQQQQQQAVAAASGSDKVATELRQRVAELEATLAATDADRAGQRQQLVRLKQQMLNEQEDEEDKIRWRVEAEVKMELEKLRANGSTEVAAGGGGAAGARLAEEVTAARSRCAALEGDVAKWEAALAARDVELQNLQRALGELSYESDAAERLRSEMRAMQAEAHSLRNDLDAAKLQHLRLQEEAAVAHTAAAAAQQQLEAQRKGAGVLQAEALSLRHALAEAQRKLHSLSTDTSSMIDRRIVVKMLITYFEKNFSGEVLDLMCSMLGFTPEDRAKIAESRKRQGWRDISLASDVTLAPGSGAGAAKQSLTDSWIEFLQQQIDAEAAGGGNTVLSGNSSGSGAGSVLPVAAAPFQQPQQLKQLQLPAAAPIL